MKEYNHHTLPNGLRLIHQRTDRQVAHCALIINTGTRDELPHEHGMAHFIEHLIFKGTKKRNGYHIISRLEDVGGEMDAYTTKEETCIYASFLNRDMERALELTSDIVFNSIFPDKELNRERQVIFDEINSYHDSPAELIFDDFEEQVFTGNPLGRNILGTRKTLKQFDRTQVLDFVNRTYNTDQMVLCVVGNFDFSRLVKYFEKHFGSVRANLRNWKRTPFRNYKPSHNTVLKKTHQAHCIAGAPAFHFKDKNRLPFLFLINLLGGPGMNNRLNMSLREKNGLVYYVEAGYTPYSDTGIFTIYFGCDKDKFPKAMKLVNRELNRLIQEPLGVKQLQRAKQQMTGQIAISLENPENLLLSLGKSFLMYGRVDSLETVSKSLETITMEDIQRVASQLFIPERISTLLYS